MEEFYCRGKLSSMTVESVRPDPEKPADQEEQRLFVAKLFYDHSGLLIRKQEARKTTFYHYNDENLLEREVEVRNDEQISRERLYGYSAGRLLSESQGDEKITYHYNNRDVLNYTTTWNGDIQESVCSYGYDEQQNIILKEIRDPEGMLLRSCRYKRNLRGLISRETVINQENMILDQTRFEYPVFHGENWLKREGYRIEEKKEPVLIEIVYRNISLAVSETGKKPHPPAAEKQLHEERPPEDQLPDDTSISLPDKFADSEPPGHSRSSDAPGSRDRGNEVRELLFKNGKYSGPVNAEGTPEGTGEFWGSDGSRYSGGFHQGLMEGRGNLLHKNGSSYTGEFRRGLPWGEGECIWPDGSRYRGQFLKGEMHGIGTFTWSDGTRFTGLFEHNKSTDQGLLENARIPGGEN
ncbi:MAG: hypothetical protein PQJ58_09310 [Spirochaetales bacterium]|nr:hypothetical protein [Spirochaetales bacterium]